MQQELQQLREHAKDDAVLTERDHLRTTVKELEQDVHSLELKLSTAMQTPTQTPRPALAVTTRSDASTSWPPQRMP